MNTSYATTTNNAAAEMAEEEISFDGLAHQIQKFEAMRDAHCQKLARKKQEHAESVKAIEQLQAKVDDLDVEISQMQLRESDFCKTIDEARKAHSRIVGSTKTLSQVLMSEMQRCTTTSSGAK